MHAPSIVRPVWGLITLAGLLSSRVQRGSLTSMTRSNSISILSVSPHALQGGGGGHRGWAGGGGGGFSHGFPMLSILLSLPLSPMLWSLVGPPHYSFVGHHIGAMFGISACGLRSVGGRLAVGQWEVQQKGRSQKEILHMAPAGVQGQANRPAPQRG